MTVTNPLALLLLLLLPVFIFTGWSRTGQQRRRHLVSLGIRLLLVTLIIMALAGIQIPRDSDRLAVVFLVDVSDSMDRPSQEAALDYVRSSIEAMNQTRDQAAVVLFGAEAVVEQPMAGQLELNQIGANPITLNTDMAEAIRLGLALFPPDAAKRMVILSDGVETVGDAEGAAQLAAATDVQIDYVPFTRQASGGEVLVQEVRLPPRVNEEELFDLVVTVESETDSAAELRVLAGGEVIHREQVDLQTGENRFSVGPLNLPATGFVDFRVQIEPQQADNFYQNNQLAAFTEVRGRPTILLVTADPREVEFLEPALIETGFQVDVVAPQDIPTGLAGLSAYSSVVLVNAPATQISQSTMELLQIYVRDLGGGLVSIGGPNSYAVGGYFETPLEETLPVDMRIRDQERIPSLTMLFVIDRSGSMEMSSNPQGITNLELAKEAIIRSFGLLNDYDRVGVISFDVEAFYVLPIQEVGDVGNRTLMENQVASLRPGGGTDIFGGLQAANEVLPADPSVMKHMIVLTDGGAPPDGIMELTDRMYNEHGITVSAVAIGQGYADWLKLMAQSGRGNFHEVFDPSTIPSIFTAETVLATRSYITEEEFIPTLTGRSPIMEGIGGVPTLQGYVATSEKDTATVIMRGPEDDPLLASWQYGLGRSVAFTSDASARWGVNWVTWENYTRFWSQAVRWTITEGTTSNLEARVEQRGEQAYLVVDARNEDGEFLNGLALSAAVVDPNLETQAVNVPQIAPGRYELAFTPSEEGAYFVRVAGSDGNSNAVSQTTGWVLSYSQEYALRETDTRFLDNIAGITGGGSLAENPSGAFAHNLNIERATAPIFPYLLGLAALLLLADIAVRRLILNRGDWLKLREWVSEKLGLRRELATTSGRMGSLMDAKRRAASGVPIREEGEQSPRRTPSSGDSARNRPTAAPPAAPPAKPATPPPAAANTASQLLKRKKDRE